MRSDARAVLVAAGAVAALSAVYWQRGRAPRADSLEAWPAPAELDSLVAYGQPVEVGGFIAPDTRLTFDAFEDEPPAPADVPRQTPSAPAGPNAWTVSAILVAGNRRVAIVNDSAVSVGDPLPGGASVVSIEPNQVVLRTREGARIEVRM